MYHLKGGHDTCLGGGRIQLGTFTARQGMSWLEKRVHVFVCRFHFGAGGPRVGALNSPMYQQLDVQNHKVGGSCSALRPKFPVPQRGRAAVATCLGCVEEERERERETERERERARERRVCVARARAAPVSSDFPALPSNQLQPPCTISRRTDDRQVYSCFG